MKIIERNSKASTEWRSRPLRYLASYKSSNVDKKDYAGQCAVCLCNYTDVYYNEKINNYISFSRATASLKEIRQFSLRRGDVIITKDSEDALDIGVPSLVEDDMPGVVCGYHLTLIRSGRSLAPAFLHRFLQSHMAASHFYVHTPGVTRFGLTRNTIGALQVPAPSLHHQQAVVAHIDCETTRIDALIEKKTRFIRLLKEKRQALITQAVLKGLDPDVKKKDSGVEWIGDVPEHWTTFRIANLFREAVRPGNDTLPILMISIHTGISDSEIGEEQRARKVTFIKDRRNYKRIRPGDLAYNTMRAWQGGIGAATVEGQVSPAYIVAEPIKDFSTPFVEHLLRTPMGIDELKRFSRGITDFRLRLYWEQFRDIRLVLPPAREQREIMEHIVEAQLQIGSLIALTERSVTLLEERRAAVITAAVAGQVDLSEAA